MGGSWGVLQSYAFEHIITYQFWQNYNIEESRGTMSGTNGEKRTHTNTKHVWIVSAKNTLRIKQCNCKSCLSPLVMTWFVNIIGATNAHAKGVELIVWQPHWFLQVLYIAQDIIIWHTPWTLIFYVVGFAQIIYTVVQGLVNALLNGDLFHITSREKIWWRWYRTYIRCVMII